MCKRNVRSWNNEHGERNVDGNVDNDEDNDDNVYAL